MRTALLLVPMLTVGFLAAQVPYKRILNAISEPQSWLTP